MTSVRGLSILPLIFEKFISIGERLYLKRKEIVELNHLPKILKIIFVSGTVLCFVFMFCTFYIRSIDIDLSLGVGSIGCANLTIYVIHHLLKKNGKPVTIWIILLDILLYFEAFERLVRFFSQA